jgi:hypothetical protein
MPFQVLIFVPGAAAAAASLNINTAQVWQDL